MTSQQLVSLAGCGYPTDEGWSLEEGSGDSISRTLPINAIKEKLDNWRNIWVPEPEEFEI